jgi:hypothetical protein
MKIENQILTISRVERISRVYDAQGRVIKETIEFFFPEEKDNVISFHAELPKPLKKKSHV